MKKVSIKKCVQLLVAILLFLQLAPARLYADDEGNNNDTPVVENVDAVEGDDEPAADPEEPTREATRADHGTVVNSGDLGSSTPVHWAIYSDGTLVISPKSGSTGRLPNATDEHGTVDDNYLASWPWLRYRSNIKSVEFEGTITCQGNISGMFFKCTNLESVNLSNLNVSNATQADHLFHTCSKLTTVDFSDLQQPFTTRLTRFTQAFINCTSLTSVDFADCLSKAKIGYIADLFNGCSKLTTVSNFGVSFNSNMSTISVNGMFQGCSKLTSVDFSGWKNTHAITRLHKMFMGCTSLTELDLSYITPTDKSGNNGTTFYDMFNGCSNLEKLNISGFSNTTMPSSKIERMFLGCSSLKEVVFGDKFQFISSSANFPNARLSSTSTAVCNWVRKYDKDGVLKYDNPDTAASLMSKYVKPTYIPAGTWVWEDQVNFSITNDGDVPATYDVYIDMYEGGRYITTNPTGEDGHTLAPGQSFTLGGNPRSGGARVVQRELGPFVKTTITTNDEVTELVNSGILEVGIDYNLVQAGGDQYEQYEMKPVWSEITFTNTRVQFNVSVDDATKEYGDEDPEFVLNYKLAELLDLDDPNYADNVKVSQDGNVYYFQYVKNTTSDEPHEGESKRVAAKASDGLASFTLKVSREPGEDVGTYEIYVEPDEDCVVDVVTKEVAGTLTITPAPLTVRTGSNAGQYTGSPITESTASITGFKFEDTATVTATGSQTEIGASKNTYRIDWGETNPENYTIIENLGTLTVYPVRPSESARRSQIPLTGVENSNRIQQLWKLLRNRKDH